ncbi:hypothetical protein DL96DRAFT_1676534 [Flagelloscypha sp. PMI_526]|nr:hypothetical protein DL96DRAFT_1676534 [Flagelloscypha sp. PMI_526]
MHSSSRIRNLVENVYQSVRSEYNTWKKSQNDSLFVTFEPMPLDATTTFVKRTNVTSTRDGFWVEELIGDDVNLESQIFESSLIRDDPSTLGFVPFADSKTFARGNMGTYLEVHEKLGWMDLHNPDEMVSLAETTRQLLLHHRLPPDCIDETKILTATVAEIIKHALRRDFPLWPPLQDIHQDLNEIVKSIYPKTFQDAWQSQMELICSNSSCVNVFCQTHLPDPKRIISYLPPHPLPECHIEDIRWSSPRKECCSNQCWLLPRPDSDQAHFKPLTEGEYDEVRNLVLISPDIEPCELAEYFRRSCIQMYHLWSHFRPQPPEKPPTRKPLNQKRSIPHKPAWHEPCNHQGPCTARSGCPCHKHKLWCESWCRCLTEECTRRWRGCRCTKRGEGKCSAKACPCVDAKRECDPRVCHPSLTEDNCVNISMQRGMSSRVSVKRGLSGFGLFADEFIPTNSFIIEYIGEIIREPTVLSRGIVNEPLKRNYIFQVLDSPFHQEEGEENDRALRLSIDGTYRGNMSRFINDSRSKSTNNCTAKVKMVNGEPRIGFFASDIVVVKDIEIGHEIFFDYGREFWEALPQVRQSEVSTTVASVFVAPIER